jgi:hypothetical protein
MQPALTEPLLVGIMLVLLKQDGYTCQVTDQTAVVEMVHHADRAEGRRTQLMGLRQLVASVARCGAPHDRRLGL